MPGKKVNHYKTGKQSQAKEQRKQEHEARKAACDKLSAETRLTRLDEKLGVGIGAKKERMRLQIMIDPSKVFPVIDRKTQKFKFEMHGEEGPWILPRR